MKHTAPRASLLVAALATLSVAESPAQAGDQLQVSFDPGSCARDYDGPAMRRAFAFELATSSADAELVSSAGDAAVTRIALACEGEVAELTIEDPVTGKSLKRRIQVATTAASARPRLLALAAHELLVASWIELQVAAPKPETAGPVATAGTRARARRVARRVLPGPSWALETSALGAIGYDGDLLAGAGVRVTVDTRWRFGGSADFVAERRNERIDGFGDVEVTSSTAALAAHLGWQFGRFRSRLAAGARVGTATMAGDADAGASVVASSVSGLVASPLARLDLSLAVVGPVTVTTSIEAGVHLLPVRGTVDGMRRTSVDGSWLRGQLAAGWRW
jgi:hypothetical protein